MSDELLIGFLILAGIILVGGVALYLRERLRERRNYRRMVAAAQEGLDLPASLHPVIDPDRCIASKACVSACPEGDVIGVIGGAGRLIEGANCIGHGMCEANCPVGAITLVFGTEKRGVDIPQLTPNFETSRPGVYIAGELGGMGLIRNAIRQGIGAARHAIQNLPHRRPPGAVDVAIVGAGPAGLGAALACMEAGASYLLIEQDVFGGAVAQYPRQKVVMTQPVEVPLFGRIHKPEITKEELLQLWNRIVLETGLEIREHTRLTGLEGEDGHFLLQTTRGEFAACKVILAIGRRGTPRRLDVPGEDGFQVTYRLIDARQYAGEPVLVVGGGDSALEAAAALAEAGAERVLLSYRRQAFYRAKRRNRERIESLAREGRVEMILPSEVKRLQKDCAVLACDGGERVVPARYAIVCIGGVLPDDLLRRLNIRVDTWFGKPPPGAKVPTTVDVSAVSRVPLYVGYAVLLAGLAAILFFSWTGWPYYLTEPRLRHLSPLHEKFRSSGPLGHGIGVGATMVMLTNFWYAMRKRIRALRRIGLLRQWLEAHVLVGLLTPAIIAYHANFHSKNLVASATYAGLFAVVITGIIGRYVYGRIRAGVPLGERRRRLERFKAFLRYWRLLHILLALTLVLLIALHVAVSWVLGYRWIL
jgi:thioredoxin reductase/Pyruvate/2-oxoacid:ferredoxin oxidoreductase delta subunit